MSARKGRFKAVLFGTAIAVFLFLSVEGAFYVANRLRPEPEIEMVVPEYAPNSHTRAAYFVDGEPLYDVTYTFDERRLRVTPANPEHDVLRHVYIFGGSFGFGQGVEDDETLANYVAAEWPGTVAHNLASPGEGTLHVFERIDMLRELMDDDDDTEEIGVYVLIPSHVNRNIGSMRVVSTWARDFPYYEFNATGRLQKKGTFRTGRPFLTAFQELLSHEQILQFMRTDIPIEPRERHIEFTIRVIVECKRKFLEVTGSDHFYVLLFPDHPHFEFNQSRFVPFLDAHGIEYLDYRQAVDLSQPAAFFEVDLHPTAATYEKLAPLLVQDLQQEISS